DRPTLRRPVLVAAFEGWNDAADAATTAARYLARSWSARPFAELDPEEFYDFTATRPQVRLDEGATRHIEWPANTFTSAALPGRRPLGVAVGHRPPLRGPDALAQGHPGPGRAHRRPAGRRHRAGRPPDRLLRLRASGHRAGRGGRRGVGVRGPAGAGRRRGG